MFQRQEPPHRSQHIANIGDLLPQRRYAAAAIAAGLKSVSSVKECCVPPPSNNIGDWTEQLFEWEGKENRITQSILVVVVGCVWCTSSPHPGSVCHSVSQSVCRCNRIRTHHHKSPDRGVGDAAARKIIKPEGNNKPAAAGSSWRAPTSRRRIKKKQQIKQQQPNLGEIWSLTRRIICV